MPTLIALNKKDFSYIVTYDDEPNIPARHILFENDLDNEQNHLYISEADLDKYLEDENFEDIDMYYNDTNRIHFIVKIIKRHRMAIEAGNILTTVFKNESKESNDLFKCKLDYEQQINNIINDTNGETKIELINMRDNALHGNFIK